jgi:hypothetical protein
MNTKILPDYVRCKSTYDPRIMDFTTFRNSMTDPVPSEDVPPEFHVEYELERNFVFVSSIMRDRSKYPNSASFKIDFAQPLFEVVSIEVQSGVIPTTGGITNDGYLLLDIPEMNHIQSATNGTKYAAILNLQYHPNPAFSNLDKSNTNNMPIVFKPYKRKLDSLTINLRHSDESLVSFGNESPNVPFDLSKQTQFTFEVRTRVPRKAGMFRNERAVLVT